MKMDIEEIKIEAEKRKCKVDDLVALSKINDPFYIPEFQKKQAEWIYKTWKKEGEPKIHPRGFFYRIVDKKYKLPNGTKFLNTHKCWLYLKEGFKYARFLDLIDYEFILDEKNPDGIITNDFENHEGIKYEGLYTSKSSELDEGSDEEEYVTNLVNDISVDFSVDYNSVMLQPYYIEIWGEKSGIIPKHIAQEFNATMRTSGAGEFSLDMCYQALKKAKELKKPLFVFLLTDFDPKGDDMPKSVARKLEFMSEKMGLERIEVYLKHIALTEEQCVKYKLPEIPAKEPKGDKENVGAKAYKTHTKMFYDAKNRKTTEINSFMARHEKEYEEAIRRSISPYFDSNLHKEVDEFEEEIRDEINGNVREVIEKNEDEIIETAKELTQKEKELEKIYEDEKERLGVFALRDKFNSLTKIETDEILSEIEIDLPKPDYKYPDDSLLDTTLDYFEQLERYKKRDIRTKTKKVKKKKLKGGKK